MASHYNVSPFSLSISMTYLTECGMRSPYLCIFCQYFMAVLYMILSLFLSNLFIQHENSGSSAIWLITAYSASFTTKDSLTSLTWFQVELPYFHWIQTSYPLVVSLLILFPLDIWIKASPSLICVSLVRESMMASNNTKYCLSWSTWENKLLSILLAVIYVFYPSSYSTLYILVSRVGLPATILIVLPYLSFNFFFTLANSGPSPCLSRASYMFTSLSNSYESKISSAYGISSFVITLEKSSWNISSSPSKSSHSSMLGLLVGVPMKLPSMYTSLNKTAMAISYTSKRFLHCSVCDYKYVTRCMVVMDIVVPLAGKP